MQISCCSQKTLLIWPWTGACEILMLNVRAHEVHQNDHSYVREVSEPTFNSLHKTLVWWTITRRPQSHKTGGWRLPRTVRYMQHPSCLWEELATHVRHLTHVLHPQSLFRCDSRGKWSLHWYTSWDLSHSDDIRWKVSQHTLAIGMRCFSKYVNSLQVC